jgi:hypothetical protein
MSLSQSHQPCLIATPDQGGGGRLQEIEKCSDSDIEPETSQEIEALEIKKIRNEPGMLMKTKDRTSKIWNEPGML